MLGLPSHTQWRGATVGAILAVLIVAPAKTVETTAIPDLSGQWGRDMLFFEPPVSGPGPVAITVRKPDGTYARPPCCEIVTSWFGDPTNPILKPEAAEAVKKFRDMSLAGTVTPDLHGMCWPEPPPYVLGLHYGVNILQEKNQVTLLYLLYNTVRRVRMNVPHPKKLVPSWQGDSVGHYEGDTLVIDTIGIKTAPFSTVDAFGTPHSDALHVVERYHLIDGKAAAEAQQRNGAKFTPGPTFGRGVIDPDTAKKGLEVEFTVEDPNVFTAPWSGRITYRRIIGDWPEAVCSENPHEYYAGRDTPIPHTDKPDF
ncbi:MAG TPA: hypothetical protein VHT51_09010 [Micropepsaceae bacterium]|jgi:hypothetical protein|nr:hypothetical protein [Micropepsaceae bacterium]